MSSPLPFPPPGFDELSREEQVENVDKEQVENVDKLSDYVTPNENYLEIPEWHREILEEAMARYEAVGMEGRPWEDVRQQLIAEGLIKAD